MDTTPQQQAIEQYVRELGLATVPEHYVSSNGVVIYVPEVRRYLVIENSGREWWTNDLPAWLPEVLSESAAARRSERMSKCKGRGKCFAWCTGKRSRRVLQAEQQSQVEDTE